jgi:Uncharacterized conserved protein
MVTLTRIYTRGGDAGQTSLGRGERVAKHDPGSRPTARPTRPIRSSAWRAAPSPARCWAASASPKPTPCWAHPERLFDLGADLCTPEGESKRGEQALRIVASQVERLEHEIDAMNADLQPLNPSSCPVAARRRRGCISPAPLRVALSGA